MWICFPVFFFSLTILRNIFTKILKKSQNAAKEFGRFCFTLSSAAIFKVVEMPQKSPLTWKVSRETLPLQKTSFQSSTQSSNGRKNKPNLSGFLWMGDLKTGFIMLMRFTINVKNERHFPLKLHIKAHQSKRHNWIHTSWCSFSPHCPAAAMLQVSTKNNHNDSRRLLTYSIISLLGLTSSVHLLSLGADNCPRLDLISSRCAFEWHKPNSLFVCTGC